MAQYGVHGSSHACDTFRNRKCGSGDVNHVNRCIFFPHAVGRILERFEEFEGEYICIAERNSDQRDNLRVLVEIEAGSDSEKKSAYEGVLRNELGFSVEVEFLPVLGTAELTQIEHRQKPLRLLDSRFT